MKVLGIVAEYNPFHNGHKFHIEQSKKVSGCDFVVAVMSGNFVQRGEPALTDKYSRTEMALKNGVDVVIELPVSFSTASAEFFSGYSIKILDSLGMIDAICFGSESGNLTPLKNFANFLTSETPDYKITLKSELDKGYSYPIARKHAVSDFIFAQEISDSPNDILGIEYLKALGRIHSKIIPYTIKREAASYHSKEVISSIASATAIRRACSNEEFSKIETCMPKSAYDILRKCYTSGEYSLGLGSYDDIFQFILKTKTQAELAEIINISEGLENRFIKTANDTYPLVEIIDKVKTKRYTHTRISRAALHMILDTTKADFDIFYHSMPYIRILGMKKESSFLINEMTKHASCPIITKLNNFSNTLDEIGVSMLGKEISSSDIYYLSQKNKPHPKNSEYGHQIIVI